jgi:hypothetical protein
MRKGFAFVSALGFAAVLAAPANGATIDLLVWQFLRQ